MIITTIKFTVYNYYAVLFDFAKITTIRYAYMPITAIMYA